MATRLVVSRDTRRMFKRSLLIAIVFWGCPKLREPERGYELKFKKEGTVREAVERRLAQAGIKAKLFEDTERLTVRLPGSQGDGAHELVELLTFPGKLEFCAEAESAGSELCALDGGVDLADAGVALEHDASGACYLTRSDRQTLLSVAAALTKHRVVVGSDQDAPQRTYVTETCISPRVLEAEPSLDRNTRQPLVSLTFDGPGATAFADLTRKTVNRRLFIIIDSQVNSAPVVREAITGGRAMITLGAGGTLDKAKQLAQVLGGGPLEGTLTLEELATYGPPSLLK